MVVLHKGLQSCRQDNVQLCSCNSSCSFICVHCTARFSTSITRVTSCGHMHVGILVDDCLPPQQQRQTAAKADSCNLLIKPHPNQTLQAARVQVSQAGTHLHLVSK